MALLPKLNDDEGESEETSSSLVAEPTSSPGSGGDAYLIVTTGEEAHRLVALRKREYTIGRSTSTDIEVRDHDVSRFHAKISYTDGEYEIGDAGSANGTFLNGKRIDGTFRLQQGDRIRMGSSLLRFEAADVAGFESSGEEAMTTGRGLIPEEWSPTSWTTKPATHMLRYDDPEALAKVVARLAKLPPLVTSWEVERLKGLIADAQEGKRFLLQGGDCAETLEDCDPTIITNKLKILLQMSLVLTHAARMPIVRIGRFAGQYAKPRSSCSTEIRNGVELPSYVGDLVNRPEFTAEARRPDPNLLLSGYHHASLTLNFIRTLCAGGFSDLRRTEYFDLSMFARADLPSALREDYKRMADGLHFMRAFGDGALDELTKVEFFASHEGLNLSYEAAQTRKVPRRAGYYDLTTHLPWIGDRTRAMTGAHIEFFRGIANPIGVKIGPKATASELIELLRVLNPNDEAGKIILIVRMGAKNVMTKLPPLLDAVGRARRRVLWMCDPMHGNGMLTSTGTKTRNFVDILNEIEQTFEVHRAAGTHLGGVHFELTGEDVTECIGGGLTEADLDTRYLTACDPRLNYRQAIEMSFHIARRMASLVVRGVSSLPPSTDGLPP